MTKKDAPASLLRARRLISDQLPSFEDVLRGSLLERRVRCGKSTCHCADTDSPGHPVVYLGVTFRGGRTEQITVPRELVPTIRRWVGNYLRWWKAIEKVSAINRRLLRLRQIPGVSSPDDPGVRPKRRRSRPQDVGGGSGS